VYISLEFSKIDFRNDREILPSDRGMSCKHWWKNCPGSWYWRHYLWFI